MKKPEGQSEGGNFSPPPLFQSHLLPLFLPCLLWFLLLCSSVPSSPLSPPHIPSPSLNLSIFPPSAPLISATINSHCSSSLVFFLHVSSCTFQSHHIFFFFLSSHLLLLLLALLSVSPPPPSSSSSCETLKHLMHIMWQLNTHTHSRKHTHPHTHACSQV